MEQFVFFLVFLGLSVLVGLIGKKRKIGFGWSFAFSIFLSPLIGLVITLNSKKNDIEFIDAEK